MFIFPMAGLSSRFFKAGYTKPKYMLEANGKSLFDHSVESFSNYFKTDKFLFIIRDVFNTKQFVESRVVALGIVDFEIVVLEKETRGQAETVLLGLLKSKFRHGSISIFNIDTFRPGFRYPDLDKCSDGYLEVFKGSGNNWSYVRQTSDNSTIIDLTTEKRPVSDLCCTGIYHFSEVADYFDAYDYYSCLPKENWEQGELYVAPLYNYLIQRGKEIHFHLIQKDDVVFCGTPEEYLEVCNFN